MLENRVEHKLYEKDSEMECFQDDNIDNGNSTGNVDGENSLNVSNSIQNLEIKNIDNYIEEYVKDLVKKEYQKQETNFFTLFGIYASLVAFLSIEVQVFKTLCDIHSIIGLTFILLGSLVFFILISDIVRKNIHEIDFNMDEIRKSPLFRFILIAVFLLVGGVGIMFLGNEKQCAAEDIYKQYTKGIMDEIYELRGNIKEIQSYINFFI